MNIQDYKSPFSRHQHRRAFEPAFAQACDTAARRTPGKPAAQGVRPVHPSKS